MPTTEPAPDLTVWVDEIPTLTDLGGRDGRPGCEYLYCDSAHEYEAQQAGWRRIGPVLTLTGPAGTCPFVVMERGEPVKGLDAHSTAQSVSISTHLTRATGLGPQPPALPEPTPVPKAVVAVPPKGAPNPAALPTV